MSLSKILHYAVPAVLLVAALGYWLFKPPSLNPLTDPQAAEALVVPVAIVGIVTDTDLVRRALASDKDLNSLTVEEIMTSPLCSIEETRTVGDAHDMMGDLGVRHLGVTKGGEVVGVISVRDLLSYYQRMTEPKIGQD